MRTGWNALAGLAAAVAIFTGGPSLRAAPATAGCLSAHLSSLVIGPAVEHRLVIVHPLLIPRMDQLPLDALRLAAGTQADLITFAKTTELTRTSVEVTSMAKAPLLLLAGDVVRTPAMDLVAARSTIAPQMDRVRVPSHRVSHVETDSAAAEPRLLGLVLPGPLRHLVLTRVPGAWVRIEAERFAADVMQESPRKSPADLGLAPLVKKSATEYRTAFRMLPVPEGDTEHATVGYAVYLDGALASVETFGGSGMFRAAWPALADAVAAEASAMEARLDLFAAELKSPAGPGRFKEDLSQRIAEFAAARSFECAMRETGVRLDVPVEKGAGEAIVLGDRFAHFVAVTDPARRPSELKKGRPDLASRGAGRLSDDEARLRERRASGGAPLPSSPEER